MLRVVIRADASYEIGTGHVMRCLSLATELRARGSIVSFICRELDGNICNLVESQGFTVDRLPARGAAETTEIEAAQATWVAAWWKSDALECQRVLRAMNSRVDWLIVDHYSLDWEWEELLLATVRNVMVIDDLADRVHSAAVLLDQNLFAEMGERYRGKIPEASKALLGPRFALLQEQYAALHDRTPPRKGLIRRIVVYFGGTDEFDLTGQTVSVLLSLDHLSIEIDVVLRAEAPHADRVRRLVSNSSNVALHHFVPSLAQLFARADLAIGAGGATTWERLCLGVPSIIVSVAENQIPVSMEVRRKGLAVYLGHITDIGPRDIDRVLRNVLGRAADEIMSRRCAEVVDGQGCARVVTLLEVFANVPLHARLAGQHDEKQLLVWANDPVTRQNAFQTHAISVKTHAKWFRTRLADVDNCRLYVIETGGSEPLGSVRFERVGEEWEVHFSVSPWYRSLGLGRHLVEAALLKLHTDNMAVQAVFGQVKELNIPSRKIFESLGFQLDAANSKGVLVYRRADYRSTSQRL